MAIDSRNLSIEGVQEIAEEGWSALHSLGASKESSNLLTAIMRINQKIEFLKSLEDKVLSLFPAPNDRESVRAKVVEYNNSNFSSFFGTDLKKTFTDNFKEAAKRVKTDTQKEQNLLAQYLVEEIGRTIKEEDLLEGETLAEGIARMFNTTISVKVTSKENAKVSSTRKIDTVTLNDKAPQILIDNLTTPMRTRLQGILDSLNGKNTDKIFPNLDKTTLSNFNASKNSLNMRFKSEWFTEIQGLSESQIKEKIEEDPQTWEPIVKQANQNIIKMLGREVSGEVRMYLENYLQGMVAKNPYIFFIGKSTTDLTGLLGEINAVLAIQKLTGKTVSVEWIAHNTSNGKKVSIDVVLKTQLGINVKNTTQNFSQYEGFHNVGFVDRDPESVLNTLLDSNEFNQDLSDAFQTSFFNTSYNIVPNRPHVVKGSNSNFDYLEKSLLNFRQRLITYLYQFAPEMLYMATDDLEKQLLVLDQKLSNDISGRGNILYMVGGVPFFPSEMMSDLQQDLLSLQNDIVNNTRSRQKSFFFNISNGSSENIISYLNSQANSGHSVALGDLSNGGKITTIQMTSAWLF